MSSMLISLALRWNRYMSCIFKRLAVQIIVINSRGVHRLRWKELGISFAFKWIDTGI